MTRGADGIGEMKVRPRSWLIGAWLSDQSVERIGRLYQHRDRMLRLLEPLPETFCHHDATSRNLLMVGSGASAGTVPVDWAMAGVGRLGEDLAALTGVALQFLDVLMSDRVEFEAAAIDGNVSGLRQGGWTGDETSLRLAYKAILSLLMGVFAAGVWFRALSDPTAAGFAEHIIRRPRDEIGDQWAELQPYLLDLGEEALVAAPGS